MTDSVKLAFYCPKCFEVWGDNADEPLVFGDVCACPSCGSEVTAVELLPWMKGLCAAHKVELTDDAREAMRQAGARASRPGPRTEAAKLRCALNGWKHGANAKKYPLPPARPGKFVACNSCPFAPQSVNPQGNNRCASERFVFCTTQSETLMALIQAHNGGGPAAISHLVGGAQGLAFVNLFHALQQLSVEGPTIERTVTKTRGSGERTESIEEVIVESNPALTAVRVLGEMLKIDLSSSNLTAKSATDQQNSENVKDWLAWLIPKSSV